MIRLYHNPRCAKSRAAKQIMDESGKDYETVLYLKEPLTPGQMEHLLEKLDLAAPDLIRKQEKLWKEDWAHKDLNEDELLLLLIEHPQLMERPILETDTRAVIGRPPERILDIL